MSAKARKRIAAAQKKRWAAIRAAKESANSAPAKKVAMKALAKKAAPVKKAAAKTAPAGKKVTIAKKAPVPKVKEVVPEKATPFSTEATPA
jgi:DNA-binding protein HU-beta